MKHDQDIDRLIALSRGLRYRILVQEVQKTRSLCLISRDGAPLIVEDERDREGIPLWPSEAVTERMATGIWEGCRPLPVTLDEFRSKMVPRLSEAGLLLVIFPTEEDSGRSVEPVEFMRELETLPDL